MNINLNDTTLLFKNIPKQIDDVSNFLQTLKIPAKDVKQFGRKRVLINYEFKSEAEHALSTLEHLEFNGRPVNIALFRKDKPKETKEATKPLTKKFNNKSVQTLKETAQPKTLTTQEINKYVQKLYATDGDLDLLQPPPPYLKYSYPSINKDIMDNICIALLSNKHFYTQVVHLMNRMNLEPPFTKREYKFTPPGIPHETGTQTEEVVITQVKIPQQNQSTEMEVIESELESSEEDERRHSRPQVHIKRKLPPQPEQYKKKVKQILQTTQKLSKESLKKSSTNNLSLKEIFDTPEQSAVTQKIELQFKHVSKPTLTSKTVLSLPADLSTQKLNSAELDSLPIYKNYQKGQASNKLYIKNLHKDVTHDDLRLIYERFITKLKLNLDIKVMQHGRMKGQAFVIFVGDDTPENIQAIVTQALEETNGLILREKPMIVCYGKQS